MVVRGVVAIIHKVFSERYGQRINFGDLEQSQVDVLNSGRV